MSMLDGKVVAITGGARGIGRSAAAHFLDAGASVAIGDRDGDLAAETAAALGKGCIAVQLDVTERASFAGFLDSVAERVGPIDVLVNNAGIMIVGGFLDEDDDDVRRQLDVNLYGTITGCKLVLPGMLERGSGRIVNVASMVGVQPTPGGVTYSATKHAIVGLSRSLARELDGTGVGISVVMPTTVNTELAAGVPAARGVPMLEPDDVGAGIVDAVAGNREEVFLPWWANPLVKVSGALPSAVNKTLSRLLNIDDMLFQSDPQKRAAYHERVERTESSS